MKAFALALLWPAMILSAGESSPWKVDPQPALAPGLHGSWDDYAIASPSILRLPDKWMLFYEGVHLDRDGLHRGGGIAESRDGIAWTKYDQNPLFSPALKEIETWSSLSVTRWKEKFWLVTAVNEDPFLRENKDYKRFDPVPVFAELMRSDDGLIWNPVQNAKLPARSENFFPIRPWLYGDDAGLHLWWVGSVGEEDRALFHSVSRDGETWSRPNTQPAKEIDDRQICCARVYPSGSFYLLTYVAEVDRAGGVRTCFVTKTSRNARTWTAGGPPELVLESHWMHSPPMLLFQPDGARLFYSVEEPDGTIALRSAWCSKSDYVSH